MRSLLNIAIVIIILISSNCAKTNSKIDSQNMSDEELFKRARCQLDEKKYDKAIEFYTKLTSEYPYSKFAAQAQIMEAYSYYLKGDYDMTANIAEDFIKIYPYNQYAPYVYYLRALSYYDQIQDVSHDQKITEQAKEAATSLIYRFKESDYARDFSYKLHLINEHLSGKEMMIGRFYLHKGEILAAIKRFNIVVESYQTSIHVEEAIYRLVEAYQKLGIIYEAARYASILGYNYPKGKWYSYAYNIVNQAPNNVIKSTN